jgi:hypothetical protein
MKAAVMTPREVRVRGFEALEKALGPAGMLRFLHQFDEGSGDYSKDRHKVVDKLELRDIIKTIKQMQKTS